MTHQAKIVTLDSNINKEDFSKELLLQSGRKISITGNGTEENINIIEANGDVVLKIQLTPEGPVISVQATHLRLNAKETLTLQSKEIELISESAIRIHSNGNIDLKTKENLDLTADKDIKVTGEMIHLN